MARGTHAPVVFRLRDVRADLPGISDCIDGCNVSLDEAVA
jgi:hypothetical protein